jgi:xylan 1,4-beta-xylosidase
MKTDDDQNRKFKHKKMYYPISILVCCILLFCQVCLRADKPAGPYEINVMSAEENLGIGTGWRLFDYNGPPFNLIPPRKNFVGCIPMHQGGIVQVQSGEWWGWSMMDHNSVGRLVCLSPVTWVGGWPCFGLPGNLKRSPQQQLNWIPGV